MSKRNPLTVTIPNALGLGGKRDSLDVRPPSRGALVAELNALQARLDAMGAILGGIDQRAMSVDGPCDFSDFKHELQEDEARAMYVLARGAPRRELTRCLKRWAPK